MKHYNKENMDIAPFTRMMAERIQKKEDAKNVAIGLCILGAIVFALYAGAWLSSHGYIIHLS